MSTCIITGASSGIGRAAAIETSYLNEYKNFVIIGRRKDELEKTADLMSKKSTCKF